MPRPLGSWGGKSFITMGHFLRPIGQLLRDVTMSASPACHIDLTSVFIRTAVRYGLHHSGSGDLLVQLYEYRRACTTVAILPAC